MFESFKTFVSEFVDGEKHPSQFAENDYRLAAAALLVHAAAIDGEISPSEFKPFIGPAMRLSQVEYAPKPEAGSILGFYMGKNTPERKDYIMERLVVPVEE